MTGATMCSGIMAPEEAMPWVEWKRCAEIESFPCSVIAARHPGIPNLGDIMSPTFLDNAEPVDILIAGTPCQAFSVAGLRKSLRDDRGNLTLRFMEVVHVLRPRITLWENVPGVLSTDDNAFGCFLAGLVGADDAIAPPAGWKSPGVVSGPIGTAAWRILDAQYFGLAQRRARLFLVFCFGDSDDPAEILFEFESMRRDSPPSREAGQEVTGTLSARASAGGGLGTDFDLGGGLIPYPEGGRTHSRQVTPQMAVRRLTPLECERLMGFKDSYTAITHNRKPAADGPRYKALGNSMAVPVLRWIGNRIRKQLGN